MLTYWGKKLKKKKNLEKRKLIRYSIFIIPVFLLSFYLSYRFDIGGQFISVVNQTTTTPTTTTTVKPKIKVVAAEIVETTTTFIITNKATTTIFIIFEKTTTTTIKSSGGGGGGSRTTTTTIPKPVAKIIINEIMYSPPGPDPGNEWLEIYNNDTFDCDISDWNFFESGTNHRLTLEKGNMIISSKGYAIIADNATNFLVNHPGFNGTAIDSTFSLSNTGEYIALKDYSLNVVDEVTYNSSWGGNETNKTLERKEDEWHESLVEGGTPGYENSVSTFVTTTTTTVTTTSTTIPTTITTTISTSTTTSTTSTSTSTSTTTIPKPVAKIIINEIMYNPPGSDSGNEWIEVYNNDTIDCNISDWNLFESGTNHHLTLQQGSMIISSGTYAIIADNATNFLINHSGFNGTVIKCSFSLNNNGEYIALKDYSLSIVDGITYNSSYGGDGNNKTLERKGNDWYESLVDGGTPGFVNSILTDVITTISTTTTI